MTRRKTLPFTRRAITISARADELLRIAKLKALAAEQGKSVKVKEATR